MLSSTDLLSSFYNPPSPSSPSNNSFYIPLIFAIKFLLKVRILHSSHHRVNIDLHLFVHLRHGCTSLIITFSFSFCLYCMYIRIRLFFPIFFLILPSSVMFLTQLFRPVLESLVLENYRLWILFCNCPFWFPNTHTTMSHKPVSVFTWQLVRINY